MGPFLVAAGDSPRRTAIAGAYAVGLAFVLGWPDGIELTLDHLSRGATVFFGSIVAIAYARSRDEREVALRRIARVARVAQEAILRPPPPEVGSLAMAARYRSASEEALVGGDLYETAFTAHGVRLILGDVRGKGLDAVGVAASVLSTFRESVHQSATVGDLARAIDKRLRSFITEEEFVTALIVEVPAGPESITMVNCGHHPPLRISPEVVELLEPSECDLPLGLDPACQDERFPLVPGERLLLYTDGLVEARDGAGKDFDPIAHADVLRAPGLDEAVDGLLERLLLHVGARLDDDLAVLLVERLR